MKKFVIHLSGPGCSGKSTVERALGEKFPGLYSIAYDKLKWQLGGYKGGGKHDHLINEIELGLFEVICKKGMLASLDLFLETESDYHSCEKIAHQYGYTVIPILLSAPKEVLLARFRERVKNAALTGSRIAVTDEAVFVSNLSWKTFVPKGAQVFDTSVMSAPEIVEKIAGMVETI